ncbi:NEK kinase [Tubulinosema ratisbonensis]|uniref:non-specific serine/threonine protein kinase n=1 Tax=Tubulinosema ratisbonensis TaxID=291195 RepID=A0A437AQQ5_9MICR|nr:NEK kinase [Tubulinosema ratisbonensis]
MHEYKFITNLGKGTHGSVFLFEKEDGELISCKSIDKKFIRRAKSEINLLKSLNHVNIIKYINHQSSTDISYIFMEYANYGSLECLINFFKKRNLKIKNWLAWSCFTQLINGISYLHSKNIAHRDIKPSNILLNKRIIKNQEIIEFKICDFSLSTQITSLKNKTSIIGTPYYMAPEVIKRKGYDEKIDVWGLGVCLYELITLEKPFKGSHTLNLNDEILTKLITKVPKCNDKILECKILTCLKKEERPSIFDLRISKSISKKICLFNEFISSDNLIQNQESIFSEELNFKEKQKIIK